MKAKNFSRASRGIIGASARLLEYAATATGPPQISWLRPWSCIQELWVRIYFSEAVNQVHHTSMWMCYTLAHHVPCRIHGTWCSFNTLRWHGHFQSRTFSLRYRGMEFLIGMKTFDFPPCFRRTGISYSYSTEYAILYFHSYPGLTPSGIHSFLPFLLHPTPGMSSLSSYCMSSALGLDQIC